MDVSVTEGENPVPSQARDSRGSMGSSVPMLQHSCSHAYLGRAHMHRLAVCATAGHGWHTRVADQQLGLGRGARADPMCGRRSPCQPRSAPTSRSRGIGPRRSRLRASAHTPASHGPRSAPAATVVRRRILVIARAQRGTPTPPLSPPPGATIGCPRC